MDLAFATAPDVAAEIGRWLSHLGAEKRMSPKTLDAYRRDVAQFLAAHESGFLGEIGRGHRPLIARPSRELGATTDAYG